MACQDCDGASFKGGLVGIAIGVLVGLSLGGIAIRFITKPEIYRQIADGELVIETHTWPDTTRDVRAIRK